MAFSLFGCGEKGQPDASGSCGQNMTWEYNKKTKTLTISGSGEMNCPDRFMWSDYVIKDLVISEGVTSIDKEAFYSNSQLSGELKLPSTLKSIGEFAFYGCSGLKGTLELPDSVESVGDYSFIRCTGFTGIKLSKSLKYIGVEAFHQLENASGELVLPEGLEYIGRVAFDECKNLKGSLVIPDSITYIGDYAFSQCGFDGGLTLPEGLTEIPDNCFTSSKNFTGDLVIPATVKVIGNQAFNGTGFDGKLVLPEGLKRIEPYAFSSCENFTGALNIPDSVEYIGASAFSSNKGFTSLKLPKNIKLIFEKAFQGCIGMTGELQLPESVTVIGDNAFYYTGFGGTLRLPSGLISLGDTAFSYCKNLTSLAPLPETLQHIKDSAFWGCENLGGSIRIPDSVYSVGEDAFWGCGPITDITFGKNVRSVGMRAFKDCNSLKIASFTGSLTPDYYGQDEQKPSFPEGCTVNAAPGASSYRTQWERSKSNKAQHTAGDAAREMPWYWTNNLTYSEFRGAGIYADVELSFDESKAYIKVNGREFDESEYFADKNADPDDQVVKMNGLFCRDGWVKNLRYSNGFGRDIVLTAEIELEDGTIQEIIFHTGSEENLYVSIED